MTIYYLIQMFLYIDSPKIDSKPPYSGSEVARVMLLCLQTEHYRHLQEPSAVAFFFYSWTKKRISICHAARDKDIGWNNQMHSYKTTSRRIFKKDRAYEKYLRSQTYVSSIKIFIRHGSVSCCLLMFDLSVWHLRTFLICATEWALAQILCKI